MIDYGKARDRWNNLLLCMERGIRQERERELLVDAWWDGSLQEMLGMKIQGAVRICDRWSRVNRRATDLVKGHTVVAGGYKLHSSFSAQTELAHKIKIFLMGAVDASHPMTDSHRAAALGAVKLVAEFLIKADGLEATAVNVACTMPEWRTFLEDNGVDLIEAQPGRQA